MATPTTIRTALQTRLRTIEGLHVYSRWPNQLNPPCAILDIESGESNQTMGRGDFSKWNITVEVIQPLAGGWENAADRMDKLLATSSTGGVFGALAGDRTLGGVGNVLIKSLPREYTRRVIDESLEVLAATIGLEVWAS